MSAKKCIDGITTGTGSTGIITWANSGSLCHSKKELAPWLALDYGKDARVSVEKVVLFNRADGSWHRTRNVEVRLTNELPTSGKNVFTGGELLGTFKGPGTKGQQIEIESGPGWEKKSGRYIVIQMNYKGKSDYLNLQEVFAVGFSNELPDEGKFQLSFFYLHLHLGHVFYNLHNFQFYLAHICADFKSCYLQTKMQMLMPIQ